MAIVGTVTAIFELAGGQQALNTLQQIQQLGNQLGQKKIALNVGTSSQQKSIQSFTGWLDKASKASSTLFNKFWAAPKAIAQFSDQFVHLGQVAATFAYRMTLVTAPLDALLFKVGKAAVELERTALFTATQIEGSKEAAVKFARETEKAMTDLAVETGNNAAELVGALRLIISSMDVAEKDATKMMKPVAMTMTAMQEGAEEMVMATTTAFNVFGGELSRFGNMQKQTTHILDVLGESVKEGRAEFSDMATGFGRAATMGMFANASFEEVVATITLLSRVFTPAQATTAAENLSKALVDPSSEAADMWDQLKISMYEVVDGVTQRRGTFDILAELMDKLFGMDVKGRDTVISAIFPTIRALRGALFLLQPGELDKAMDWVEDWENMAPDLNQTNYGIGRNFAIAGEGIKFLLDQITALADAIGQKVYDTFREDIKDLTEGLIAFTDTILSLPADTLRKVITSIMGISALGPLSLVLSTVLMGLGGLVTLIAELASPMGILALIAGWKMFGAVMSSAVDVVREYTGAEGLRGLIRLVIELAEAFGLLSTSDANRLLESVGLSIERINSENFREFVDALKDLGDSARNTYEHVKNWFEAFGMFIDKTAARENLFGIIVGFIVDLVGAITKAGEGLFGEGVSNIEKMAKAIDVVAVALAGLALAGPLKGASLLGWLLSLGITGPAALAALGAGGLVLALKMGGEAVFGKLSPGAYNQLGLNYEQTAELLYESMRKGNMGQQEAIGTLMQGWGVSEAEARQTIGIGTWSPPGMTVSPRLGIAGGATMGGAGMITQAFQNQPGGPMAAWFSLDRLAVKAKEAADSAGKASAAFMSASDALTAIGKGMGDWWEAFKEEHGGKTPIETYKLHERPLQAAVIDKTFSEYFAKAKGRSPEKGEWDFWWQNIWGPLESYQGGPISEVPPGYSPEMPFDIGIDFAGIVREANQKLAETSEEVLPDLEMSVEDLEKAFKEKADSLVVSMGTNTSATEANTQAKEALGGHIQDLIAAMVTGFGVAKDTVIDEGSDAEGEAGGTSKGGKGGKFGLYSMMPIGPGEDGEGAQSTIVARIEGMIRSAMAGGAGVSASFRDFTKANPLAGVIGNLAGQVGDDLHLLELLRQKWVLEEIRDAVIGKSFDEAKKQTTELNGIKSATEGIKAGVLALGPPALSRLSDIVAAVNRVWSTLLTKSFSSSSGSGKQSGGYVWSDNLYRLAEHGKPEFVISNPTLRALEKQVGVVTQGKLLGTTTVSIGNVNLPGVRDAKDFVRELKSLANDANAKRRLAYGY
uniref:Putative tail protein n=1 Tax=viral metagenome TaxID=1070528 RepID=A0A6M3XCR5_9ZZZZ